MRTILLSLIVMVCAVLLSAQPKDLSQKPASFNNPEYVYGTSLNSPLTSLNESFEGTTFPPAGWVKINPIGGTGWERQTAGTPLPGWTGGSIITTPPGGGNAVAYCTWSTGAAAANDQWLVTPRMMNTQPDDSLFFMLRKTTQYLDKIQVKISTTTATVAAFTVTVLDKTFPGTLTDTAWTLYSFRVGNLVPTGSNIYIAFREFVADNVNDGAALSIDLVKFVPGAVVPVELTSFGANVNGHTVQLSWATATETNNRGFEIQKKAVNEQFVTIGFVNGKGTTTQTQNYSFTDKSESGKFTYRLRQVDLNGVSELTKSVEVVVAPDKFELGNNYPNPFNPSTKISFNLSVDSKVSLRVYNLLGQEVSSLVNGNLAAGSHEVSFNASNLATGVYMYKLDAAGFNGQNFTSVKKMILNK